MSIVVGLFLGAQFCAAAAADPDEKAKNALAETCPNLDFTANRSPTSSIF